MEDHLTAHREPLPELPPERAVHARGDDELQPDVVVPEPVDGWLRQHARTGTAAFPAGGHRRVAGPGRRHRRELPLDAPASDPQSGLRRHTDLESADQLPGHHAVRVAGRGRPVRVGAGSRHRDRRGRRDTRRPAHAHDGPRDVQREQLRRLLRAGTARMEQPLVPHGRGARRRSLVVRHELRPDHLPEAVAVVGRVGGATGQAHPRRRTRQLAQAAHGVGSGRSRRRARTRRHRPTPSTGSRSAPPPLPRCGHRASATRISSRSAARRSSWASTPV